METLTSKKLSRGFPWLGSERRKNPRKYFIAQVDCKWQGAFCIGRTLDLSIGGLLMATTEPLDPGTPVEVRFAIPLPPQAVTVEAKGVVIRANPRHSMAIKFTELDDYDRDAIRKFLEKVDLRR